jgi:flavodoxin
MRIFIIRSIRMSNIVYFANNQNTQYTANIINENIGNYLKDFLYRYEINREKS